MRKQELNILNVILCLLVIFIHSSGAVISGPQDSFAYKIIFPLWNLATVAVPAFIFLSGLKSGLNTKEFTSKSYAFFITNKIKKIYIPYLLWVVVYYIWFVSQGYFSFSVFELLKYILNGTLAAHFYFVIIIMQFYLLLPIILKATDRYSSIIVLSVTFFITAICEQFLPTIIYNFSDGKLNFIYNDRLFSSYLFYYVFGIICAKNYDKFIKVCKNKLVLISCIVTGVLFCISYQTPWYNIAKLLFCTATIPCLIDFSRRISASKMFKTNTFKAVNSATYNIYLSHLLIMQIIDTYLISEISGRLLVSFCIRLPLLVVLSFVLCTLKPKKM